VVIGEETGAKLRSQVIALIHIAHILTYCLLVAGSVLVVSAGLLLAVFLYRRRCLSVTIGFDVLTGCSCLVVDVTD